MVDVCIWICICTCICVWDAVCIDTVTPSPMSHLRVCVGGCVGAYACVYVCMCVCMCVCVCVYVLCVMCAMCACLCVCALDLPCTLHVLIECMEPLAKVLQRGQQPGRVPPHGLQSRKLSLLFADRLLKAGHGGRCRAKCKTKQADLVRVFERADLVRVL